MGARCARRAGGCITASQPRPRRSRARGGRLTLRRGDSLDNAARDRRRRECGATQVYWNRLYEPALVTRDARSRRRCATTAYDCESFNAALLFEPWEVRTGPGRAVPRLHAVLARVRAAARRAAAAAAGAGTDSGPSPRAIESLALDDLELLPRVRWDAGSSATWTPGEAGALARLDDVLRTRNLPVLRRRARSAGPAAAARGCRRTCTSVKSARGNAWRPCAPQKRERACCASSGAEAFLRELGWREFAHHLLFHFPAIHRTHRSTRGSSVCRGATMHDCSTPGSAAAPAIRSSMPACASCGPRAGCTTACA